MNATNRWGAALIMCAVGGIGAAGCNTVKGVGKDIQRGGKAIENATENARFVDTRPNTIVAARESIRPNNPLANTNVSTRSKRTYNTVTTRRSDLHPSELLMTGTVIFANGMDGESSDSIDNPLLRQAR